MWNGLGHQVGLGGFPWVCSRLPQPIHTSHFHQRCSIQTVQAFGLFCHYSMYSHTHDSQFLVKSSFSRIEKSREVIPTLLEAAKSKKKHQQINWEYVYNLLFTRENLKLVQVGCHKKAARSQTCQKEDFLTNWCRWKGESGKICCYTTGTLKISILFKTCSLLMDNIIKWLIPCGIQSILHVTTYCISQFLHYVVHLLCAVQFIDTEKEHQHWK